MYGFLFLKRKEFINSTLNSEFSLSTESITAFEYVNEMSYKPEKRVHNFVTVLKFLRIFQYHGDFSFFSNGRKDNNGARMVNKYYFCNVFSLPYFVILMYACSEN